ncbi:MAG TPA: hypothetical protein PKY59_06555 [Pyrinomonadaceae bacterium]|nr:hypothetical protein [Pyrinomonadaceae bacterium]
MSKKLKLSFILLVFAAIFGVQNIFAQTDYKPVIEQINSFRTDPANARANIDKMIAAAFPEANERNEYLNEDYENKKRSEHIANFVAFVSKQSKLSPLEWNVELVQIAAAEGKSKNKFFLPDLTFGLFHADPKRSLLDNISSGLEHQYKGLFIPNLRFGAIAPLERKADDVQLVVASAEAKAYLMSDEDFGNNAYDPRLDKEPAWVYTLNMKEPNVIPFVKADGTSDVAWRRMSDKKVFINRYSANGAKLWTKEAKGVSEEYILLAGFTEDPQGNMYLARAIDEGDLDKQVEPSVPKDNKNNEFDRSELMRLTKLDKDANELWTKDFAKKGGTAMAFFSPLSPKNNGNYAATSKLAYTTVKQVVYKLASDESVIIPTNIAEQCLLGYSIDRLGKKSASRFDVSVQPTEENGVISPKAQLQFDEKYTQGVLWKPEPADDGKPVKLNEDGSMMSISDITFAAGDFGKFNEFLDANKIGEGKEFSIPAAKLKLKAVLEEIPLVFVLYGAATDYDFQPQYKSRHQNAYWRALDARTGEPLEGYNHGAMAHSFDYSVLVTDEGIITAERSDAFLLMSNYLQTGRPSGPVFLPVFSTVSRDNECFCSVGGLAQASDGYVFLYAANNSKYEVTANRDDGVTDAQYNEEETRQRDIGILRVKKGFAQEVEAYATKDNAVFKEILDSRKKPAAANALFGQRQKYITNYFRDGQPYSAGRPRIVRVAENQYVVFWERWNHIVTTKNGKKELNGTYDSTWAMKIDQNGNVLKPAIKISDTLRLMRGDDPVNVGGKAAFFAGDILTGKMMLHTIDGELKLNSQPLALN